MPEPIFDSSLLKDCIKRSEAGDPAAMNDLLRVVLARLEKLTRKMFRTFPNVRGHAELEDVLQNSLLRLLPSLRRIKPATTRAFYGLAALHIRWVLLDLARACQGKAGSTLSVDWANPPEHMEPMALQDFDTDRWILFHQAVDGLPIEDREVVGLIFYHGWSQKQIAELLQVDERTIRRRWSSAKKRLQSMAGAIFDEE